jgi:hypothetical protein
MSKGVSMKRTLATTVLVITTTTLTFAAGVKAADAETTGGCAEPVPVRSYTADKMTYRLDIDLTDCAWWDRRTIELGAALDRVSATADGGGAGSLTWCAVTAFTHETADMSDEGEARFGAADADGSIAMGPGWCAIQVSIDHPPLDTAHYKGAITFPWEDGPRTVSFNAVCSGATGCVDLPADPTPLFAPAAELYDAISGEGDRGA